MVPIALDHARVEMQGIRSAQDCASAKSALSLIQGVSEVSLSEDSKTAVVAFDPVQVQQFTCALRAVGFKGNVIN